MRRAGIAAVLLLLAGRVPAQTFEELMQRGDAADVRGKTKKAALRYEAAIAAARTPEERVAALLAYTDAVRGAEANQALDDQTAATIDDAYRRAIAEATARAAFKAHNDYGVFLLDRLQADAAVAIFDRGQANLEEVASTTAARYLSNFGLAYVRAGCFEEALETYRRAIEKDPAFDVPMAAAYSVIRRMEPARIAAESAALVELLMKHGRGDLAQFVITDDRRGEWLRKISDLAGEPPLSFDSDVEGQFAGGMSAEERRELVSLLQKGGDDARAKDPRRAAGLYIAAWKLDRTNAEPLTHLADLLSTWEDGKLLDRTIAELFESPAPVAFSDPAAALRLHMILGSIFETKERWGPRIDPRTAVYHYTAALDESNRVRSGRPDAPHYPGSHASLASALAHLGDKEGAWRAYVAAAAANFRNGDRETAAAMLALCETVGYDAPEGDRQTFLAARAVIGGDTSNSQWP